MPSKPTKKLKNIKQAISWNEKNRTYSEEDVNRRTIETINKATIIDDKINKSEMLFSRPEIISMIFGAEFEERGS